MSDVQGAVPPTAPAPSPTQTDRAPPAPQPVTIVEPTKPSIEDTMRDVYLKNNPPRTEDGKFEAKTPPVAEVDKPPATEAKPSTEGQTAKPESAEPAKAPATDVPVFVPAEVKEEWAKAPPAVRDWIAKRETETHNKISDLGRQVKASEQLRNVVEKHRAALRGTNEAEAIDRLFAANAFLEQSPTEGLKWLANQFGVDLSTLANAGAPSGEAPDQAVVGPLRAQIAELQRQLHETNNRVLSREQREVQSQQATLAKLIDDFKSEPSRAPHWDKLEEDIHAQVIALKTSEPSLTPEKLLEKAYNRALRINDEVSKQVEAENRAKEAKQKAAEDAKKAEEAKKLASLNVKTRESGSSKPSGNWEDTMREVGRKLIKTG